MNIVCVMRTAILSIITLLFAFWGPAYGQEPQLNESPSAASSVVVGVYAHPPFVMKENGRYTGMAIELWEWLAQRLGLETTYRELNNVGDLVEAAAAGDIDIAVTNMTVTKDRAERIDFTHPWFDAGQRIMVNDDQGAGFSALLSGLSESGHLRAYAWIALVIVLATFLVTLFDRHFDKDFPRRWRDGIADSFYVVMSVATSGRMPARKNLFGWIGRIWQAVWLVCGIAVLAYVTSSVTSVMTTLSLSNQIHSVADLSGHVVAVQPGSIAQSAARELGLKTASFDRLDSAVAALQAGRVDAIIDDAPVLEYYAHTHPESRLSVVGPIFSPDKYAFGLTHLSPLTRPLTVELIGAHESGFIEQMRARYFGDDS